jgi:hypothetical protein
VLFLGKLETEQDHRCHAVVPGRAGSRLAKLLAEAHRVNQQLANATNMADGDLPIPNVGPPVGDQDLTPTRIEQLLHSG